MGQTLEPDYFSQRVSSARRFYLELAKATDERLIVSAAGRETCTSEYRIERGGFPEGRSDDSRRWYVLEFVAAGAGEVTLAGTRVALDAGVFYAYGPHIPHRIVTDPRSPLVKYFAVFASPAPAATTVERHSLQPGAVMRTSAPADVATLFDELVRTGMRRTELTQRILAVQLEHLILRLAESAVPLDSRESAAFATYRRCRQYIQDRWAELTTLEQLARECGVAPGYVCRLFQRFDHQTPYQYLLQRKMTHAADRLARDGASVKELAHELGFSDPFHFSRVFKKTMGLPPVRFARACGMRSEPPPLPTISD